MKNREIKTIKCAECGKYFDKEVRAFQKKAHVEGHDFCSLVCSGRHAAKRRFGNSVGFGFYVNMVRQRAKKRGLRFDLSSAYLSDLFKQQHGRCAITGITMVLNRNRQLRHIGQMHLKQPNYASLDRIDNTIGYIRGNVQFVCLAVNYMRNTFSIHQVREFIRLMRN